MLPDGHELTYYAGMMIITYLIPVDQDSVCGVSNGARCIVPDGGGECVQLLCDSLSVVRGIDEGAGFEAQYYVVLAAPL